MLTTYLSDPACLEVIQHTPAAPHLDGFAAALVQAGYHSRRVRCHLRTAAHASHWLQSRGRSLIDLDANQVGEFKQHLAVCRCLGFQRTEARRTRGAELFLQHLQDSGFIAKPAPQAQPPLFAGFCRWMRQHRGAKDATLDAYGRIILDALQALGEDQSRPISRRKPKCS